ncbi:helix-turn-helix transcriptional regulator [Neobacillus cucumis]|uniref:helix-turn-helix domain-containing protein n=1 Tax=Neobacillus cucumis TaxID=1740721 RepID=UPI002E208396|nr:helix-turn-helix transcriptional regulator [Neobacillus cucumis]
MDFEIISKRLKNLRKKKGITIQDLAAKSGISKSTIDRIERNEQIPKIDLIFNLCSALEINIVDLFNEDVEMDFIDFINVAKKLTPKEREKVTEMLKTFIIERENY